jgi:hypothetical protein
MSWLRLVRFIRGTGSVAEAAPTLPELLPGRPDALAGSVQILHVDSGSCNGCEIEWRQRSGRCTTPNATVHVWWLRRGMPTPCW